MASNYVIQMSEKLSEPGYIIKDAYPKLDSSRPLATSVNCCAASRVLLNERALLHIKGSVPDGLPPQKVDTHPNTARTNLSFASGPALDWMKSSCNYILYR